MGYSGKRGEFPMPIEILTLTTIKTVVILKIVMSVTMVKSVETVMTVTMVKSVKSVMTVMMVLESWVDGAILLFITVLRIF